MRIEKITREGEKAEALILCSPDPLFCRVVGYTGAVRSSPMSARICALGGLRLSGSLV